MSKITILVGPPGSGKTTYAKTIVDGDTVYVNQDSQGKQHLEVFNRAILAKKPIVVDRMNFNVGQRRRYLDPAKAAGYETEIVVFHVPMETCLKRCMARQNHETIKDVDSADDAVRRFFKSYERVSDTEADKVSRLGWDNGKKNSVIVCDLDGTLADMKHRRKFLDGDKPDWKNFFMHMDKDLVNVWCQELLNAMSEMYRIVYATGRPEDYMGLTRDWLERNGLVYPGHKLFSRLKGDFRKDNIVKEIILEFEIKPRYDILMVVDDRTQVVQMWRSHGYTVLQCDEGNF